MDVAEHAEAIATSDAGSLLAAPPGDGTPWRPAPIPEIDRVLLSGNAEAWEAADALGVGPWHARGWDGSGVKVAVFDVQWFNSEQEPHALEIGDAETWDCFAHPSCDPPMDNLRPRFGYELGSHGVACAEVVRDLAPGVELHLVRVNALTTFESAMTGAARHDIDLITMSLSFFNESFYDGTGDVAAAVDRLGDADTLLVTSAGNYATEQWSDRFTDTDGDGWHEFRGVGERLPVSYKAGGARVSLIWDDFTNCGDTDLDIYAFDAQGRVVGRAAQPQVAGEDCSPMERLSLTVPDSDTPIELGIWLAAGSPNVRLDVMARNGDMVVPAPWGSVTDPGTHPDVFTVGAVRATPDYLSLGPEPFSSWGPTNAGLPKPDIAGPDGVSSSIYGSSGFFGTSASTPAVTAAIALVMSRYPDMTPREAAAWLQAHAVSDARVDAGPDYALGAGRAHLPPPGAGTGGCGRGVLALPLLFWLPLGALRRRRA